MTRTVLLVNEIGEEREGYLTCVTLPNRTLYTITFTRGNIRQRVQRRSDNLTDLRKVLLDSYGYTVKER